MPYTSITHSKNKTLRDSANIAVRRTRGNSLKNISTKYMRIRNLKKNEEEETQLVYERVLSMVYCSGS